MDVEEQTEFKYWAFISYSHKDEKWGKWLHKSLEAYRIPKKLIGREARDEMIPKKIFPVFRDREELPTSADLGENIAEALDQSRYLIVICSPYSAVSKWVDEEIKTFVALGKANKVLCFIVDGEPNATDKPELKLSECFPLEIRKLKNLDGKPQEPIAADVRNGKDGKLNAKLKIIAGLLGVGYDELKQRELQRKKRKIFGLCFLVSFLIAAFGLMWRESSDQQKKADSQSRVAFARQLVLQADALLESAPQRSLLLALESCLTTYNSEGIVTSSSENTLRKTLTEIGSMSLHNYGDAVGRMFFDPQGRWLVTVNAQNHLVRLWNLMDLLAEPLVLIGQKDTVERMTFDPKGEWLAAAAKDGTASLWSMTSPRAEPVLLRGHKKLITKMVFDSLGRRLATGDIDGNVMLWDLNDIMAEPKPLNVRTMPIDRIFYDPKDTGKVKFDLHSSERQEKLPTILAPIALRSQESMHMLTESMHMRMMRFDPSGNWLLVTYQDNSVLLWNMKLPQATPVELYHGLRNTVKHYHFDSQGHWLATSGKDGVVTLWNLTDLEAGPVQIGERGEFFASMKGRWLVTSKKNGMIRLWNLTDLEAGPVLLGVQGKYPISVVIGPRGRWLASSQKDGSLGLWDLTDLDVEPVLSGKYGNSPLRIDFDLKGLWLAAYHKSSNNVWLFSLSDPLAEPKVLRGHEQFIKNLCFDPKGRWLSTADEGGNVRIWSLFDPEILYKKIGYFTGMTFDQHSRWLAMSEEKSVRLWSLSKPYKEPFVLTTRESIFSLTFDIKSHLLAVSEDKSVEVWNLTDLQVAPVILNDHEGFVSSLAFDPQGRWIATGDVNGIVRLWNLTDLQVAPVILNGHEGSVSSLAFDPQGRWIATGGMNGIVRLWNLTDLRVAPVILNGHKEPIYDLTFDFNGQWLIATQTGKMRLWSMKDKDAGPIDMLGNASTLFPITFSEQGEWIAAVEDKNVLLWSMTEPRTEPVVLRGNEPPIFDLTFGVHGHRLASWDRERIIRLWTLDDLDAKPIVLQSHGNKLFAMAYDDEGSWLATVEDDTLRLRNLSYENLFERACNTTGRNFTCDEWLQYFGSRPYRPTCPQWPNPVCTK